MSARIEPREVLVRTLACGAAGALSMVPLVVFFMVSIVGTNEKPVVLAAIVGIFELFAFIPAALIPLPTLILATPRPGARSRASRDLRAAALCGVATAIAGIAAFAECAYVICAIGELSHGNGTRGTLAAFGRLMSPILANEGLLEAIGATFVIVTLSTGGLAVARRRGATRMQQAGTALFGAVVGMVLGAMIGMGLEPSGVPKSALGFMASSALTPLGLVFVISLADALVWTVRRFWPVKTVSDPGTPGDTPSTSSRGA
jgi:hypothetical protein